MRQRKQVNLRGESARTQTGRKPRARGTRANLSAADERLLRRILAKPMDFIDSEEFYKENAAKTIYDDAPPVQRPDVSWYRPLMDDFAPSERRSLKNTGTVLLTGAEERVLFLQYNYAPLLRPPDSGGTRGQRAHAGAGPRNIEVVPRCRPLPRADRRDQPGPRSRDGQADPA